MRVALGFDTSCYTTSAAVVDETGSVSAFSRMLLPVASGQRGLRQSEAVFAHIKQLPQVTEQLAEQLDGRQNEIACVCVSSAPTTEENSYMPVFQAGLSQARSVAALLGVPLYTVSHQQGHIAAGRISNPPMPPRFAALHISGGTTDLLLCENGIIKRIGGSLDLHAGQLIDRLGVAMGLRFPAGPALEQKALACTEAVESLLPVSMEQGDLYCHLSGAETKALQWLDRGTYSDERIAAEVFDFLSRTLARLLAAAKRETACDTALVVGGVASSTLLRERLTARLVKQRAGITARFGQPCYSSDNAAGVALLGIERLMKEVP